MATAAIINVNQIVDEFMLAFKKPDEDAFTYLQHACNCVRDYHLFDSPNVVTEKVTINSNKWIEMPSDMVSFNGLMILQSNGSFWPCTERGDMITTTTTTAGVEGRDSTIGEGAALTDPKSDTYGGVGGVNDYYYNIDWKARRIYTEGFTTETVVLKYTTTGIEISGTTSVPTFITPLIHDYLLWKECYWIPGLERFSDMREKNYNNSERKIRNLINAKGYDEWHDLLLSITTMSPQR